MSGNKKSKAASEGGFCVFSPFTFWLNMIYLEKTVNLVMSLSMRFDIITIFPHIFNSYFNESILKRAKEKKLVDIRIHNLRDFTKDKHKKVDDKPYGGGAGMVLQVEPMVRAVEAVRKRQGTRDKRQVKVVLFSAKGKPFNQRMAFQLAKKYSRIIMISGRYEGIDERVKEILKADEVSIGPYVLTDGEVAAMVVVSAVSRLIPGVIRLESLQEESHWNLLLKKEKSTPTGKGLEYPHYTRPEVFVWPLPGRGKKNKKYAVPKVLLSGDHKKIEEWRRKHQK